MLSLGLENRATSVLSNPRFTFSPRKLSIPPPAFTYLPGDPRSRHAPCLPPDVLTLRVIFTSAVSCSRVTYFALPSLTAPIPHSSSTLSILGEPLGRASKLFHSSLFPLSVSQLLSSPSPPCVENSRPSLHTRPFLSLVTYLCKYSPS